MERSEIIASLSAMLDDALEQKGEYSLEDDLIKDLKFNSISLLYLAFDIEEKFGISLKNAEIAGISTLGDWVDYIEKKVNS